MVKSQSVVQSSSKVMVQIFRSRSQYIAYRSDHPLYWAWCPSERCPRILNHLGPNGLLHYKSVHPPSDDQIHVLVFPLDNNCVLGHDYLPLAHNCTLDTGHPRGCMPIQRNRAQFNFSLIISRNRTLKHNCSGNQSPQTAMATCAIT